MLWSPLPRDESPVKATRCPQQTKRSSPREWRIHFSKSQSPPVNLWRMLLPEQSSLPKSAANTNMRETGMGDNFQAPGQTEYELLKLQDKLRSRHLKAQRNIGQYVGSKRHSYT